jgi:Xaa-Pro aminopeptidase
VKRGLIALDREQLPAATFDARLERVRAALAAQSLPALVVYTDVWRSNQARFLTNFMPYWNRSLVVIPREQPPVLLCALSPRVYPWIKSVTIFEEIRPAGKLAESLAQLCGERGWNTLGVLDLPLLPHELNSRLGEFGLEDVPSRAIVEPDDAELAMRKRAARLAREILERELAAGEGHRDYELVGRLEREFRRAGAEDVAILLSSGRKVPMPANGSMLTAKYSAAVALEYCGHWVKIARAHAPASDREPLRACFDAALRGGEGRVEDLTGGYPWEVGLGEMTRRKIFALTVEAGGLYYGDTCVGEQPL